MKKLALVFLLPLSAHAGMLCDHNKLVTSHGGIFNYPSESACQDALAKSRNGFICNGRRLITEAGNTYDFPSDQQCDDAVANAH